jgi:hypothetical protein
MKDLFNFLIQSNVTPNGMYLLYCLRNNVYISTKMTKAYDLLNLVNEGYIDHRDDKYILLNKGLNFINQCDEFFAKKSIKKIKFEDIEEKIKEYNSLFPRGKKTGTITFRTAPKQLYERFIWFFNNYPEYTWDDVINVTKLYVDSYEKSGDNTYMQTSAYFIKKDDKSKNTISNLANLCYSYKEGDLSFAESTKGYHFFE